MPKHLLSQKCIGKIVEVHDICLWAARSAVLWSSAPLPGIPCTVIPPSPSYGRGGEVGSLLFHIKPPYNLYRSSRDLENSLDSGNLYV